jgi:hypothetical protein
MSYESWPGELEFVDCLNRLSSGTNGTVSKSRVTAVAKCASRHGREVKMIVHEIEKCIKKNRDSRLACLYSLNEILLSCPTFRERDLYCSRLETNIRTTVALLLDCDTSVLVYSLVVAF